MFGANSDWFSCERKFSHELPTKHKIHKKFSTTKNPISRHTFSTYRLSSMCGHSVYTTGSESIPLLPLLPLLLPPPVYHGKRSPCRRLLFFLLPLKTLAPTPRLLPAIWECAHVGMNIDTSSVFSKQTHLYPCAVTVYTTTGSGSIPLLPLLPLLPPVYCGMRSPCRRLLLPLNTLAPTPRLLPAIWECVDMWGWTVEHQSINNTFYYTYMSLTPVKTMKRLFFFHSAKWATRPELYPRW